MNTKISALLASLLLPSGAFAQTIFTQDFESGVLGSNESVFGNFSINDTNTPLNNGTLMMGHAEAYGPLGGGETPLPSYSYYQIALDLRGWTDAELRFDFTGGIEKAYDGFNLVASTTGELSPPEGLLDPTAGSGLQYGALDYHGQSSRQLGPIAWSSPEDPSVVASVAAVFDLSEFDDQKVLLRFQFGTDSLEGGDGANFDNIVIEGIALPDTDMDGMHDGYEDAHGLDKTINDRGLDLDMDGVSNGDEYDNCTDPDNPDTDEDGLSDKVETNTGIFVDALDTGTDPLKPDTDGDSLGDALENNSLVYGGPANPGTSPLLADTDGDGFGDLEEIERGTDPTDGGSFPPLPLVIGYWPFDDGAAVTEDLSQNGNDGTVNGGAMFVPGSSGEAGDLAIQFDGIDDSVTTDVSLLNGLEELTMSGWVKFDVDQAARTGLFGQNDAVEFGMINAGTLQYWTPVGGAIDSALGPMVPWTHLLVTNNATERAVYINGVRVNSGAAATPGPSSTFFFNIGGGGVFDDVGNFFNGQIDDVAVWDRVLTDEQIGKLASGELTPIGPPNRTPFVFTSISYNAEANEATITWNSRPNRTYSVFFSDDLSGFQEITDNWDSQGETTSFTDTDIPAGTKRRYYQVQELDN